MVDPAQEVQQQMVDPAQEGWQQMVDPAQEGRQQMVDPVQEVARPQQQLEDVAGTDSPQKTMEQLVPGTIYSHVARRLAAVSP